MCLDGMVVSGTIARGVAPILVIFPTHKPPQLFRSTSSSKLPNIEISNVNRRCWVLVGTVSVH